jgi:hypothetical protein
MALAAVGGEKTMFKFATGMAMVAVWLFMLQGTRISTQTFTAARHQPGSWLWAQTGEQVWRPVDPDASTEQSASPGQSGEPGRRGRQYRAERCARVSNERRPATIAWSTPQLRYRRW